VLIHINYGFYPAFVDYQGSTTLRFSVSREMITDVCRSFARFGVKRFYIINIGISTKAPLEQAANLLKAEGVILRYTDLDKTAESVVKEVRKQEKGTHADEIETSIMLYIAPQAVNMKKAVKDYGVVKGDRGFPFNKNAEAKQGLYSLKHAGQNLALLVQDFQ
jgi:creatinine amidohydrolase